MAPLGPQIPLGLSQDHSHLENGSASKLTYTAFGSATSHVELRAQILHWLLMESQPQPSSPGRSQCGSWLDQTDQKGHPNLCNLKSEEIFYHFWCIPHVRRKGDHRKEWIPSNELIGNCFRNYRSCWLLAKCAGFLFYTSLPKFLFLIVGIIIYLK